MLKTEAVDYIKDVIEQATADGSCTTTEMWKCNELLNKLGRKNDFDD